MSSKGALRLAIFLSCISGFFVSFSAVVGHYEHGHTTDNEIRGMFLVCTLAFLVPFGIVTGIAWVIAGFREQSMPPDVKDSKPSTKQTE